MTKRVHPPPKVKKPRKKIELAKVVEAFNLPRIICVHLIGEDHTIHHRMGVGVIVMVIGVIITRCTGGVYMLHFVGEIVGQAIHGFGTIPFGEALVAHADKIRNKTPTVPLTEEELEEIGEERTLNK
jgi:hypothetical protein